MPSSDIEQHGSQESGDVHPPEEALRSANKDEDGVPMAVQTKELRTLRGLLPEGSPWMRRLTIGIYAATAMLVLLALYALVGGLVERGRVTIDDLRYGRPRTTHLEGFVGHGEDRGIPTHIIAMNLNRRVVLIELPGGEPSVARVVEGPYLFGADESLTPIELRTQDMDGDGTPDLLMTIRREQIVYLNKDGMFRLPTAAEQAGLSRGQP
ncbi:MAG: hypothetical protein SH847_11930 [Roseiflexaceae bacterium]|nr:hypothetical protein [Roseiflexaceae bacterium]